MKLTSRQQAIFDFVVAYKQIHDRVPSDIREIQAECHIPSTSNVTYNLIALEKRGLIRLRFGLSRSIEVVGGSWIYHPQEDGHADRHDG
jgi:SOS-response transcriptional repressor LexA